MMTVKLDYKKNHIKNQLLWIKIKLIIKNMKKNYIDKIVKDGNK